MKATHLLTVESSFVLTGLGVLVRGAAAAEAFSQFDRHTALAVVLVLADGREIHTVASVEEITRPAPTSGMPALTEHALLLQLPKPVALPPGTEVRLSEQPSTETQLHQKAPLND
ncbi:hypothetical protein LGH70_20915 [Hymenobacter sp. BT635]|uniref:Uncharacterized protein n=1 Tax=Hymenobacter nitidus TaxID=2880929 RepID=A0ABS8AJ13_9BACT|nr:hypothetical protein [Hymenobacter nitidus]MCB2380069.1 hypothetical protein [Hymenobacter nitidus]